MPAEPHQPSETESLTRRIEQLERENERLRRKLEPIVGPDNPCFDPHLFQSILTTRVMLLMAPLYLMLLLLVCVIVGAGKVPAWHIGSVPVFDFAGQGTRHPGLGLGIVAFGGVSLGVFSIGGLGLGLIAVGGGAIGVIAIGGGACGLIAIGGGAIGYIAIGGGAAGFYALGQRGQGQYVLALNRQDPEAIALFTRLFPALRRALTTPMPVILLPKNPAE